MADEDRKARLAAIREKAGRGKDDDAPSSAHVEETRVVFRNYKPQDSALQPKKRPHNEAASEIEGESAENRPSKNKKVEEEQDIIAKELRELSSDEINIVPKKPNWDLKQQVAGKLDKLRRRTQRAVVDILREKVAKEAENDDID